MTLKNKKIDLFDDKIDQFTMIIKFKIYNSLTKKIEEIDLEDNSLQALRCYICGPTVYDQSHLGHARTYLSFDIFQRIMKHFKIDLKTQMNITDVDDKIIKKSQELKISPVELTENETEKFLNHLSSLECIPVDHTTYVSSFIQEILGLIHVLIQGGYAYQSNGSVYFNILAYLEKGLPFPLRPEVMNDDQLKQGDHLSEKKDPRDFALWKAAKEGEPSEVTWKSDFGLGRPGWHTECVAMILSNFEKTDGRIDFHFGGHDLVYPHHQNEIVQALAYYESSGRLTREMINLFDQKALSKYWSKFFLHIGQLNDAEGKKMSKSKGNFVAIDDLKKEKKLYLLRMLVVKHHYRAQVNWTEGLVEDLQQSYDFLLESLDHFFEWSNLAYRSNQSNQSESNQAEASTLKEIQESWETFKKDLETHLTNDFHLDTLWVVYQDFTNGFNKNIQKVNFQDPLASQLLAKIYGYLLGFWLGMGFTEIMASSPLTKNQHPVNLVDLIVTFRSQVRESAILNKNREILKLCDQLRDTNLENEHIRVKDIDKKKSVWSFKKFESSSKLYSTGSMKHDELHKFD